MKRTTLIIKDELMKRVKVLASSEGRTLTEQVSQLLEEGLRIYGRIPKLKYKFNPVVVAGDVLPGVDISDRQSLGDIMDPPSEWKSR